MIERNGRCTGIRVSSRAWGIAISMMVLAAAAVVLSVAANLYLRKDAGSCQHRVAALSRDAAQLHRRIDEAVRYRQWADTILNRRLNSTESAGKGTNLNAEAVRAGAVPGAAGPAVLDIRNLRATRVNLSLDFLCALDLVNTKRGGLVSGYLFLIASNHDTIPPRYAVWPATPLRDGLPIDHTAGSPFRIRYMKQVQAQFLQPDIGSKFNRIDAVAFSADGTHLMRTAHYIERMLQESPCE